MHAALLARLSGRPMALAPRALDGLLALAPDARGPMLQICGDDRGVDGYAVTSDGIAVVPVLGPLLTRGDWLSSVLGASDYGTLGRMLEGAFADPSARATRRAAEQGGADLDATRESLLARDKIDSGRATAPLVMADGAVHIDTTPYTLEEVIGLVVGLVEDAGART